jgi:hypothetical protein
MVTLLKKIAPPNQWGDISQAIIYHQVRKYLLRLGNVTRYYKINHESFFCVFQKISLWVIMVTHVNRCKKRTREILAATNLISMLEPSNKRPINSFY